MSFGQRPPRPTLGNLHGSNGSPISVICNKIQEEITKIISTVEMSDDGAEVTLGTNDLDVVHPNESTPSKEPLDADARFDIVTLTPDTELERRFIISTLPNHSLMDDEPTPSPMSPNKRSSRSMNLWCSSQNLGCYKCDDQEGLTVTNATMEHTINNLLGSTTGVDEWCTSWQAWTYFEMDEGEEESVHGLKDDIKRKLRNRAGHIGARASRITTLKQDLDPFDVTPTRRSVPMTKTTSFCVATDNRKTHQERSHHSSRSSLPSVMDICNQPDNGDSPFVIRSRGLEDDMFYDSDPEECTKQRSPIKTSRRSRMSTFWNQPFNTQWSNGSLSTRELDLVLDVDLSLDSLNMNDSFQVHEHVQEVLNQRFTMVWHPCIKKKSKPVAIVAWIERGQKFGRKVIQPRLAWKKLHDGGSFNDRHSVDLLDISRILEVSRIDRNRYPLAQRKNCLLIQCLDQKMLFEASTEKERDRLCRDLKLVVARLGSKIIMEDDQLFEEFFVVDEVVPGRAPIRWEQHGQVYL